MVGNRWEILTVNDTLLREKNQVTLPTELVEAAGLTPTKDRIAWRFEDGELRGRKVVTARPPKTKLEGRITNVDPLPKKVLERIYRRREEEDEEGVQRFIKAQAFGGED